VCSRLSLREIAAELQRDGHVTAKGGRYWGPLSVPTSPPDHGGTGLRCHD
jgi:hypothetical protein